MRIIGLTGPTGSGKSTVAGVLKAKGFEAIDCDLVAREVVEKGSPLLDVLAEAFGDGILNPDGVLNRKALAKAAFSDTASTEKLNSIMLPFIADRIKETLENYSADGVENVLLDAPTLFESGLDRECDAVLAVLCPRDIRKKRIIVRDSLSEADAETRLKASKPDEFYLKRTSHIIYNSGDLKSFEAEISKAIGEILQ